MPPIIIRVTDCKETSFSNHYCIKTSMIIHQELLNPPIFLAFYSSWFKWYSLVLRCFQNHLFHTQFFNIYFSSVSFFFFKDIYIVISFTNVCFLDHSSSTLTIFDFESFFIISFVFLYLIIFLSFYSFYFSFF